MTVISLRVVGVPAPQGSKSAIVQGGRARVIEGKGAGRQRHEDWRRAVDTAARAWLAEHPQPALDEPVAVAITFWFPLPAGDAYRTRHCTRPDSDKLVRSVFDSLVSAGLLRDDSLVWRHAAMKLYARNEPPGALVEIEPYGDTEAADREELKARARKVQGECRPSP